MHSTKTEILALLKRGDGGTVEELSSALGLASMTVRQHLMALERDKLVAAEEVRRQTGRPHFRFRLTENGHRTISDGYDRLVALLIEQAGSIEPQELGNGDAATRRNALVRRAAAALAERYRGEVEALSGDAQMDRLVEVLRSHGGFAEWHEHADGYEVRDFNCIVREHVGSGPCVWHETFLTETLGAAVRMSQRPDDGCAACCRYIVPARVSIKSRG